MPAKWEYVVERLADPSAIEGRLNQLGAAGWECVDIIKTVDAGVHLVLKRCVEPPPPPRANGALGAAALNSQ